MHTDMDYIVDEQGHFRFTNTGLDYYGELLKEAGIHPESIKTYRHYLQAKKQAQPFYMAFLQSRTERMFSDKPDNLEWQALRSLFSDSCEEQQSLIQKLTMKQKLTVI